MAVDVRHSTSVALLAMSVLVTVIGGFLIDWWEVRVDFSGSFENEEQASRSPFGTELDLFEARPFSTGAADELKDVLNFAGPDAADQSLEALDRSVDDEAVTVGVLLIIALVLLLGSIGFLVAAFFQAALPAKVGHIGTMLAMLLGIAAVLLAPLQWPGAFNRDAEDATGAATGAEGSFVKAEWWGSDPVGDPDQPAIVFEYSATWGWYLAIVGVVILPAAAGAVHLMPARARDESEPATTTLAPGSAPPALPTGPTWAVAQPASASPYAPHAPRYGAPPTTARSPAPSPVGQGPRRLSVIKKSETEAPTATKRKSSQQR